MSHGQDYYANFGGLTVAEYVQQHIRGSEAEMARMRRTVELVPADVKTLLDVGAGHGVFLEELRSARGIAGIGIEITPAKVDYAQSCGVDMRLGDASALKFSDGEFDAVVSCEVLEHLPFGTYEAAIREFARVARKWVIITVPFDENRRFVRCPYCNARINPDYHFRSFSEQSMQDLLPGFRLEQALKLGRRRRSALVELGRRFIEPWPTFLVCPSCRFHRKSVEDSAISAGSGRSQINSFARRAAGLIPALGKPVWLVGVFSRDPTHE